MADWIFDSDKCSALLKKIVNTIFDMSKLEDKLNDKKNKLMEDINTLNLEIKDLNTGTSNETEDEKEERESKLAIKMQELDQKNSELTRVCSELAELQWLMGTLKNDQSKIEESKKNAQIASDMVKNKLDYGTDLLIGTLRLGPGILKQSATNIGDAWKNGTWLQTAAEETYSGVNTWIGHNIEEKWLRDAAFFGADIAYNFASGVITLVFSGDKEGFGKDDVTTEDKGKIDTGATGNNKTESSGFKLFGRNVGGKKTKQTPTSGETEPKKNAQTSDINDGQIPETSQQESSGTDKAKTDKNQATQKSENPTTEDGAKKVGDGTQGDGTQGGTSQKNSRKYGDTPADVANKILTDKNAYAQIGNGEERKKNLKDAGYTEAEINKSQAIINQMMDNYKNDNSYRFTLENAKKEETKLKEGEK